MFQKIVSGGQTGADRAALDFALSNGIDHGGWCPKGRRAEDGSLDDIYRLDETPRKDYRQRTEWNVRDSDATLIVYNHELSGGSAYTAEMAQKYDRPCLLLENGGAGMERPVRDWLDEHKVKVLNVAGPRSSTEAEIYTMTRDLLEAVYLLR